MLHQENWLDLSQHLKKKKMYVAFLGFRKAFDRVKRNVLWNVLLNLGIRENMFNTVRAMYSSVLSCVRSNPRNTKKGSQQCCLVTPVLFSFLINELASDMLLRGNKERNCYLEKLNYLFLCLQMTLLCFHPHQSAYRTIWMSSMKLPTDWACLLTLKRPK